MTTEAASLKRIAIIGGGPAGTSCALTLLRGARERGREIEVLLIEPKRFGEHYNQCAGVLTVDESLKELMGELGLQFPHDLSPYLFLVPTFYVGMPVRTLCVLLNPKHLTRRSTRSMERGGRSANW